MSASPAELSLFNSLTKQLETFLPLAPPAVSMYVCGPTVYDEAHLGHARCYIVWDVLYRLLQCQGYTVRYVRNITDVDDKILNRAKSNGEHPSELAQRFTQRFHAVMGDLNVLSPTLETKATEYIPSMIAMIEGLLASNHAYKGGDGTVYFNVAAKKDYGKLKGQNLDDLESGARVDVDDNKKNPLDFALWKPAPLSDPLVWEAPFGSGRPGWHIECSAMSFTELGERIDIHCGGLDLIFPHHENEIAQSECFTGKAPFANVWLHNGFVNVSGDKMSKSLGNFATIAQLMEQYDANTLRYFILSHHWRSPVDFTHDALESAKNRVEKCHRNVQEWVSGLGLTPPNMTTDWITKQAAALKTLMAKPADSLSVLESMVQAWYASMLDDMNTARAMAAFNELVTHLNTRFNQDNALSDDEWRWFWVMSFGVGFDFSRPVGNTDSHAELLAPLTTIAQRMAESSGITPASLATVNEIMSYLLDVRQQLRANKQWGEADQLRDELGALGIQCKDRKDAPAIWEWKAPQTA